MPVPKGRSWRTGRGTTAKEESEGENGEHGVCSWARRIRRHTKKVFAEDISDLHKFLRVQAGKAGTEPFVAVAAPAIEVCAAVVTVNFWFPHFRPLDGNFQFMGEAYH